MNGYRTSMTIATDHPAYVRSLQNSQNVTSRTGSRSPTGNTVGQLAAGVVNNRTERTRQPFSEITNTIEYLQNRAPSSRRDESSQSDADSTGSSTNSNVDENGRTPFGFSGIFQNIGLTEIISSDSDSDSD